MKYKSKEEINKVNDVMQTQHREEFKRRNTDRTVLTYDRGTVSSDIFDT